MNLLKAGYLEDWTFNATLSGMPQGGIVSPILVQHLPRQVGQVRRDDAPPSTTPGDRPTAGNRQYRRLIGTRDVLVEPSGTSARGRQLRREAQTLPSSRPRRPRLPPPALRAVRRRFPARLQRATGRSRGDQATARRVPARDTQAGALRDQDPDHPRATGGRAIPRLRRSHVQHDDRKRSARPPFAQRQHRTASARRRSSGRNVPATCATANRSIAHGA